LAIVAATIAGIIGLLRKALIEKVRLGTPGFRSRFHRPRSDDKIEESQRRLIGLFSLLAINPRLPVAAHAAPLVCSLY
jgi:hypothetical protein